MTAGMEYSRPAGVLQAGLNHLSQPDKGDRTLDFLVVRASSEFRRGLLSIETDLDLTLQQHLGRTKFFDLLRTSSQQIS
jgi:hypothetical protein